MDTLSAQVTSPTHHMAAALPPEAPLAMPVQDLHAAPNFEGRPRTPVTEPRTIALRRLAVVGSALLLTAFGAWRTHMVLDANGVTSLGLIMLVLFVALFIWIALAFTSSLAGFFSLVTRGGLGLGITRSGPLPTLQTRAPLLPPTSNQPHHRFLAGL